MSSLPAGFRFGPVSLGCVTFGREIDRPAAFVLMDHAHARGINYFDTAAAYADGASEQIVGAWLADRRPASGSCLVGTKAKPPFTSSALFDSVEKSRRRLGVAALDVLFLHQWDPSAETPEVLEALGRLVRDGLVRALGASNFSAAQLERTLAAQAHHGLARFKIVQNNHNLAVREVDAALRRVCAAEDIAILTYSPLGAGFLTGKHRNGTVPGSRFDIVPGHQNVYFQPTAFRRLDLLQKVAARTGQPPEKLALAWALHQPGVASVLIGGRTPAHLDQTFAAQAFDDPALWAELSAE
jgi:aryl-alcohol dehydrogenase-like predicted oxidoreductase